jgi:hypothetical protein
MTFPLVLGRGPAQRQVDGLAQRQAQAPRNGRRTASVSWLVEACHARTIRE